MNSMRTHWSHRQPRTTSKVVLQVILALLLLCLLAQITGCSTVTTQYVKVPVTPIPVSLLQLCQPSPPPSDPLTYGASVQWNELLLTDLQNCNSQLSGIRKIEEDRQNDQSLMGSH